MEFEPIYHCAVAVDVHQAKPGGFCTRTKPDRPEWSCGSSAVSKETAKQWWISSFRLQQVVRQRVPASTGKALAKTRLIRKAEREINQFCPCS